MPNQVLEGVQQRLSQRLQSDLQGDAENRKAQAEGLHKVIWSPDATDEQRERAQVALEKLYPHSKDLLGKVREVSSKVFGFLKAPPGVAETGQQKSSEILGQAADKEAAASQIDPDVARVYSGIGLPAGLAPSLPPPPGMAGDPGAGASAPVTMPQAGMTRVPAAPLAPPPSMTQDIGSVVRAGAARKTQEEIAKEQRASAETYKQTWDTTNAEIFKNKELSKIEKPDTSIDEYEFAIKVAEGNLPKALEIIKDLNKNKSAGQRANLQHITGEVDGKPVLASYDPEDGHIYVGGRDVTDKFQPKDSNGEPLYPVVQGNQIVYMPRSQAAGQAAPRTIYDPSGMPSLAGQPGVSTQPPPTIPEGAQASLSGWKTSIDQIEKDILPQLKESKSRLGPLAGRILALEIDQLGGYGAKPEQIQLAMSLRRSLMSQAFADGGKNLTGTEKEIFDTMLPKLTDTYEQAVVKAQEAANYLRGKYEDRLATMPVNQRRQMAPLAPPPSSTGGTTPPPGARGGTAAPTGQQFKDGDTFNFNGQNLIRRNGVWVPR